MLAAMLIAGRSGSAITAQIGVMRVTDELDAMRVMGISHGFRLVMPRVHGAGHRDAADQRLDHRWRRWSAACWRPTCRWASRPPIFMTALPRAVPLSTTWCWRMSKSVVFGVLIALIGCHFGLRVKPNTESLGARHHRVGGDLDHGGDPGRRAVRRAVQGRGDLMAMNRRLHPAHGRRRADGGDPQAVDRVQHARRRPGGAPRPGPHGPARRGAVLVGGSGTGKTVLLRQILGLEQPGQGRGRGAGRSRAEQLGARRARPAASACCSSTARCSRPSACWRTSPFRCANSRRCPTTLIREAAHGQAADGRPRSPSDARQDAVRPVRRHDQARGAGAGADHGPAAAAAGRAHRRPGPGELRRLRATCCARCTATWR